ncbi:MAG: 3-hydroxybutyrate oligomer hydrolase family protein [Burkholderiaceae bacterium]
MITAALLAACGSNGGSDDFPVLDLNVKPAYVGTVTTITYDGTTDDLLTAGLGKTGLGAAIGPTFANPTSPTAAELRKSAIYNNYRALLDPTAAGGYGTLYGPNVDAAGNVTTSEGKIAGVEYTAFSDDGSGFENVTLVAQIPNTFDQNNPCIVTATSSGSRGVYGAISTAEWGLKRGCAVALTDKGTEPAPHDLQNDSVALIDGTRTTAALAGKNAVFHANLTATQQAAFNTATPNRLALKHAHSQRNPEKDWGKFTLQAVEFAFYALNQRYGLVAPDGTRVRAFKAANTIVIASAASNGGGAALAAAELDTGGLIDGVAVAEPNVEIPPTAGIVVQRGGVTVANSGKTLFDYFTNTDLYSLCATQSTQLAGTPGQAFIVPAFAIARCQSLKDAGLLTATTTAAQADEALSHLRTYGYSPESDAIYASLSALETYSAIAVTYANTYSRASVADNLCNYSFAGADATGNPIALLPATLAALFANGNGVPPGSGIQLINNASTGGAKRSVLSISPSSGRADYNLDGSRCLRGLLTTSTALQTGIAETYRTGNLRGKPAIIVHGRDDALIPVSHTSRPYLGMNKVIEGTASKLSYIEVTNAQHFDTFIGLPGTLPGYDSRYVPLHLYLIRALDAVYANLKTGAALPASQIVRTVPRGGVPGSAPAITTANVPTFVATPTAQNTITVTGSTVSIPE